MKKKLLITGSILGVIGVLTYNPASIKVGELNEKTGEIPYTVHIGWYRKNATVNINHNVSVRSVHGGKTLKIQGTRGQKITFTILSKTGKTLVIKEVSLKNPVAILQPSLDPKHELEVIRSN